MPDMSFAILTWGKYKQRVNLFVFKGQVWHTTQDARKNNHELQYTYSQ